MGLLSVNIDLSPAIERWKEAISLSAVKHDWINRSQSHYVTCPYTNHISSGS